MKSTVMIHLRIDKAKRALIDRAAEVVGKSRSQFILDAACEEATGILLERTFFHLDEKAYKRFIAALDKAPAENSQLRRLLTSKSSWDR